MKGPRKRESDQGSTFTFARDFPYIASILFTRVKIYVRSHVKITRYWKSTLNGSPNECWLQTCDASVLTTRRLGLLAPVVARKKRETTTDLFRIPLQ